MTLHWRGSHPAYYAVVRDGGKYVINKLSQSWTIHYFPHGTPDGGWTSVPWTSDKRTITTAKASCEAHATGESK